VTQSKHLSDLRRCLAADVIPTILELGNRLAFEFFQGFFAWKISHDVVRPDKFCNFARCGGVFALVNRLRETLSPLPVQSRKMQNPQFIEIQTYAISALPKHVPISRPTND